MDVPELPLELPPELPPEEPPEEPPEDPLPLGRFHSNAKPAGDRPFHASLGVSWRAFGAVMGFA
jgi:hypothetical protein